MRTVDEREAICRLKQGDIGGLETLVTNYQARAVKAAYLIMGDRSAAEDVVATAFLRAYDRIDQFDSRRPFGPWFLRIVVNDAMKTVSRMKRQVSLDERVERAQAVLDNVFTSPLPGPDEEAERGEDRRRVWEAIQTLSPAQRSAIVLRYYLGLDQKGVSDRMGRSLGTIKRYLHEARKNLRALLESTGQIR